MNLARIFTWLTAVVPAIIVAFASRLTTIQPAIILICTASLIEAVIELFSHVYAPLFSRHRRWLGYWMSAEQNSGQFSVFLLAYRVGKGLSIRGNVYSTRTAEWVEDWSSESIIEYSPSDLFYIYTGAPRAPAGGWSKAVGVCLISFRFDMNAKLYREAKGFFSESLAGERSGADAEPTLKDRTYTHISRIDADLLRYYGVANQGRSLARIRFDAQELARAIARKGFR